VSRISTGQIWTALERDEQIARWIELQKQREVLSQVGTKTQGGAPERGTRKAARALKIAKNKAHRATQVAGLTKEAKEVAKEVGLDDNRSVLLAAKVQGWRERRGGGRLSAE
jgi:hypothetical protein